MTEAPGYIEVYETVAKSGSGGEYAEHRWRLVARNGEVIASGEGYVFKRNLLNMLDRFFPGYEVREVVE